jgi:2-dehydro-3-deoxyphosphooctonate aldolase (KDO 8-P synthase)
VNNNNLFFETEELNIKKKDLFFILGPCVIESENITLKIADTLKKLSEKLEIPILFKASFDKANRSSVNSFRGPGMEEGLRILRKVKEKTGLPIVSDIHEPWQAKPASEVLSVIQIPAFLCRQTDLLVEAGKTGLPVNVKKGQFMAPDDMKFIIEKINSTGNNKIMLTERGTFFGYRNMVVDFRNIPIMAKNNVPVIIDATHSVQRPTSENGTSGGNPEFIPLMASAGIIAGANGVFMEVHPNPKEAKSDGTNSLKLNKLESLLIYLKKIYNIRL